MTRIEGNCKPPPWVKDAELWLAGREFYLYGIESEFRLLEAIRALGYYAWFGDFSQNLKPARGDDQTRERFIWSVIQESQTELLHLADWDNWWKPYLIKEVRNAVRWRRTESVTARQQKGNQKRKREAGNRITTALLNYYYQTGQIPSISRLSRLARANKDTVRSTVTNIEMHGLSHMSGLAKPKAIAGNPQVDPAASSHSFLSLLRSKRNSNLLDTSLLEKKKERRTSNEEEQPVPLGPAAQGRPLIDKSEADRRYDESPSKSKEVVRTVSGKIIVHWGNHNNVTDNLDAPRKIGSEDDFDLTPLRGCWGILESDLWTKKKWRQWKIFRTAKSEFRPERKICKFCGAPIIFLEDEFGNNIPVTPKNFIERDDLFDPEYHDRHWESCAFKTGEY